MKKLLSAAYIGNFQILLLYEDEQPRIFDFREKLNYNLGDFEDLKDEKVFQSYKILKEWNTLEWENGYDISPEILYNSSKPAVVSRVV